MILQTNKKQTYGLNNEINDVGRDSVHSVTHRSTFIKFIISMRNVGFEDKKKTKD